MLSRFVVQRDDNMWTILLVSRIVVLRSIYYYGLLCEIQVTNDSFVSVSGTSQNHYSHKKLGYKLVSHSHFSGITEGLQGTSMAGNMIRDIVSDNNPK